MTEDYKEPTKEEYEEILGVGKYASKEEKVEGWVPAQDWYKNPDDALYAFVADEEMQQELEGMDDYKKLISKA